MSLTSIKTRNTGTNTVEVHVLSDSSKYQDFTLQTGTPITKADGSNFVFALIDRIILVPSEGDTPPDGLPPGQPDFFIDVDLVGIKTSNTDTGTVEVHILFGDSNFQDFTLQTGTPITEADGGNFVFAMAGRDLVCIKKSQTGTGTVEVHILSAASNYQDFTLHTGTPITEADGSNFVFAVEGFGTGDLVGIKKSQTGTGTVEVHILSAASNYQDFTLHTGTPITEADGSNFVFPSSNG